MIGRPAFSLLPAFPQSLHRRTQPFPPLSRCPPRAAAKPRTPSSTPTFSHSSPSSSSPISAARALARTLSWVRRFVVALNLCPFADGALAGGALRLVADVHARSDKQAARAVLREIFALVDAPFDAVSTTLLVLPNFSARDFERFHALCEGLECAVEEDERLADQVMLVWFHPLHQWAASADAHCGASHTDAGADAGVDVDGDICVLNYDRRAPYPVVNLLRAAEVDEYIQQGKTQHIVENNRVTLQKVGAQDVERLFNSLSSHGGDNPV